MLSSKAPGVHLASAQYHDVTLLRCTWRLFHVLQKILVVWIWVPILSTLEKKNSRDFPEAYS